MYLLICLNTAGGVANSVAPDQTSRIAASCLGLYCLLRYICQSTYPASILYKSTAGRYRPVSYPDGPITARYRFIKNADRVFTYMVKIVPAVLAATVDRTRNVSMFL